MDTQKHTSANTSLRQVSRIYRLFPIPAGSLILDYGAGKYDENVKYMKSRNSKVLTYDPYNRTSAHNTHVIGYVRTHTPDIIVCANVLNVIDSDYTLNKVLKTIRQLGGKDTKYMFSVYQGNMSGIGCTTKHDCYQRNWKTAKYIPLLSKYFKIIKKKENSFLCT